MENNDVSVIRSSVDDLGPLPTYEEPEKELGFDIDGVHDFLQNNKDPGDIDFNVIKQSGARNKNRDKYAQLKKTVDWDYFKMDGEERYRWNRNVHLIPEFLRKLKPTADFQIDLNQFRVSFYSGKDLDFAEVYVDQSTNRKTPGGMHNSRMKQSFRS